MLYEAFRTLVDQNSDGVLSLDEIDAWVRGRKVVGETAVSEALSGLALTPTDEAPPWEVSTLRDELCAELERRQLTMVDLLEAWDAEWVLDGHLTRAPPPQRERSLPLPPR